MDLRLRPLRIDDEDQARAAHAELARDGFAFLLDWESAIPWGTYLEGLGRRRRGLDLSGDRVPAAFLVADVDGELVGRVSIRYALNAFLADFGGHIGYGVRPGHRGRGYATEILRQSLVIARAEGVDRALVICDEVNVASATVIQRVGGRLEDVRLGADGTTPIARYWIA
ncbi:MAG TPA: GNAT family N-acetyltransferase [Solirubrobacteraceae bacterium]